MSDVAKIVLSLAGGAFGAATLALVGAWIGRRSEHKKWIRQERLDAYKNYLRICESYAILFKVSDVKSLSQQMTTKEIAENLNGGQAVITLLGPDAVAIASDRLRSSLLGLIDTASKPQSTTSADVDKARTVFVEAARNAVGVRS